MIYTPRWYQDEAAEKGVEFFTHAGKRNGIIILPTGAGKSLIAAMIASALGDPLMVFQPSKEILVQNRDKFQSYGFNPAVYSDSLNSKEVGDITLATIGSVKDAAYLFQHVRHVLIDECDLVSAKEGMYKSFFKALPPGTSFLGLTATPYRLHQELHGCILKFLTRTRPRIFDDVLYYVQNRTLFEEGYLCPLVYHQVRGFEPDKVKINTNGTDYDEDALKFYLTTTDYKTRILRVVERLEANGRRNALIFTRYVEEAEYLATVIPGCAVVSAKTPDDERDAILRRFKAGEIKWVCNVGVLSVGFDFPELECVVLARPTMSLRLFYQMCGRGFRIHPNKQDCWIIDMCGMLARFGKIEDLEISPVGGWHIRSGPRQLTNVHFGGDRSLCKRCGTSIFYRHHVESKKPATLQKPFAGQRPDVVLVMRDNKRYYEIDSDSPDAEFVRHHQGNCMKARAYKMNAPPSQQS